VDRRLEFHRRANRARGENCAGDFASSSNKTSAITSTTCRAVARTARRTATIANLDYFFAYPEDYAQASVEWVGKEFKRRPHHPAFEIIFVYSRNDGTLDIYLTGDRKPVPDLQAIFADTILKAELGPDKKDERVYDLDTERSRQFQFVYDPESGIADVAVKKLRLTVYGKKERIVLDADPSYNKHAVFDLLDKVAKGIPVTQMAVTQDGIKVTFAHNPKSRKPSTRSFDIGWPNSCSLKHDGRDLIIRKMLADSHQIQGTGQRR
jgi:hypothetical protein